MKRRLLLVLTSIFMVLIGAGCSGLIRTPVPTSLPVDYIPTIIALTVQAGQPVISTPTRVISDTAEQAASDTSAPTLVTGAMQSSPSTQASNPSATPSPIPTKTSTTDLNATSTRRPTRTPTNTPTPTIPNAGVQIATPGPMSKVISPIHVIANLRSVPSGSYHVELWAEPIQEGGEARLLYREVRRLISNPVDWVFIDERVEFELSRVSDFGQLRLSMFDPFERPVSVNSVDLLLLSMGSNEITPKGDLSEPLVIREPAPNKLIQGGKVTVAGLAKPIEQILQINLVASNGRVVGYSQVFVTAAPDGSYVPYTVEVPYQVASPTWVRLMVSESGVRIPGVEVLSSIEVLLSP